MEIKFKEVKPTSEQKVNIAKSNNPLISEKGINYLNYRVKQEELSSRLYLAMSMYLENIGYVGAAKALKKDSDDEMIHANWAREYLLALGIQPETPSLEAPLQSFTGLPDILYKSYDHEVIVTKQINDLGKEAISSGDLLLLQLVMKYQNEQIEEMEKAITRVDRLKLLNQDDKLSMIILDQELGDGKI